jgi:hypothetical protein
LRISKWTVVYYCTPHPDEIHSTERQAEIPTNTVLYGISNLERVGRALYIIITSVWERVNACDCDRAEEKQSWSDSDQNSWTL